MRRRKRSSVTGAVGLRRLRVFFLLAALAPLAFATPVSLFSQSHPAMGTVFTIFLYARDRAQASENFEAAFDEIDRIDATLSNYQPTSELSRINREAFRTPVTTDGEVFDFLQHCFAWSRASDGAFDVTVGPLMRAWGFFRGQGRYPTAAELRQARVAVGWQNVQLSAAARTVRFLIKGVELDPGGIGKGYAVDRVASQLHEAGITAALIDAGSSTLYAIGAPPGKEGWPVQVPQPRDRKHSISTVFLHDTSLSTSGSYEKFFQLNGRTYCHIMDPRTGEPVQGTLQTTVIAPLATDSDALSTATFVMGPQQGAALLRERAQTSALWLLDQHGSAGMVALRWPDSSLCATKAALAASSDIAPCQSTPLHSTPLQSNSGGPNHP